LHRAIGVAQTGFLDGVSTGQPSRKAKQFRI
jgi:hypothetical protein